MKSKIFLLGLILAGCQAPKTSQDSTTSPPQANQDIANNQPGANSCNYDQFIKSGASFTSHTNSTYFCTPSGSTRTTGPMYRFAIYENSRGFFAKGFNDSNWQGSEVALSYESNCNVNATDDDTHYDHTLDGQFDFTLSDMEFGINNTVRLRLLVPNQGIDESDLLCRPMTMSYCNNNICW